MINYFLLSLMTISAQARVGLDGPSELTPEFVCRLTMKDSDGNSIFCTGTLISEDRISTAGHCTARSIQDVQCGYHSDGKNPPSYKVNLHFSDLSIEKEQNDVKKSDQMLAFHDFGVFRLKKPVRGIEPLRVMPSQQKMLETFFEEAPLQAAVITAQTHHVSWAEAQKKYKFYGLKQGLDCKVSGFGNSFNNGKVLQEMNEHRELDYNKMKASYKSDGKNLNKAHDYPVTASMKITKIPMNEFVAVVSGAGELTSYQHTEFLKTGSTNRTTIEEGDSGGPLYCRLHSDEPYTMIGINESIWNGLGGTRGVNYGGNVFSFLPDEILAKAQPTPVPLPQNTEESASARSQIGK